MNNNLNAFKNMTEEEKEKEIIKIEKLFPEQYLWDSLPAYTPFLRTQTNENNPRWSEKDKINLYIGRIISILDEFGETQDWAEYAGGTNLKTIIKNYENLIIRYYKEIRPELYSYYLSLIEYLNSH